MQTPVARSLILHISISLPYNIVEVGVEDCRARGIYMFFELWRIFKTAAILIRQFYNVRYQVRSGAVCIVLLCIQEKYDSR